MRLADAREGSRVRIVEIPGGDAGMLLRSRGIRPGVVVSVVSNSGVRWSPVIVEVRGSKIAIGRNIAESVIVELEGGDS